MGAKVSKGDPKKVTETIAKKGGVLGIITSFLGFGGEWNSAKSSMDALISFPSLVMSYLKWVAIGGAVLAGVFLLVFIWRFSRGDTPDVIGAAKSVAALTPAGRAARIAGVL
jgi:Na+-transporting methylmalonyl-CoA/oxaloacetate decarboxylase beta subunit